jgi:adenine-specific DNA-methyltransferase
MDKELQLQSSKNPLKEIESLKAEIKRLKSRKKYGLVWEEKPEQVVELCKEKLPVLTEDNKKEIKAKGEAPVNVIIEGDNYHSLSVLSYTHKGKIDAIYADPPYNTGAADWKYNNNYVDKNDAFRHSKWISFIYKRLKLAKDLLKEDGIICVTIDDYEIARLLMIMEEVFGEDNHLGTIVIRNNPAGRSTTKGISITHEYAVFFGKTAKSKVGRLERNQKQIDRYGEEDEKGKFEWVNFRKPGSLKIESPKMFYPIFASDSSFRLPKIKWNENKDEWDLLEKPNTNEKILFPVDDDGKERRWRWGVERFLSEKGEFTTRYTRGKLHIYVKGRINDEGVLPMTWWDKKEYSSTAYGTNLLKDIFSELQVFSYPKSIFAVIDCLSIMSENKNGIFLDFFAGSGTTGQAVLELNKNDKGNRKFILCTNNENKIAEEVCYQRIKKVIEGYTKPNKETVAGLGGQLKYYRTDFVDGEPTDRNKKQLVDKSTEMLCLKENCFDEVKSGRNFKIFKNNQEKYLGIIYDDSGIEGFKKEAKKLEKKLVVFVFSLDDSAREEEFEDIIKFVELKPIPAVILNVYKRIFR